MTPPLVTFVTPCWNAAAYVGETIESVLAQTHPRVEQVVVDDGSTDGSPAIVERYAAAHPDRVRLLRLDAGRGPSHARNRGVEMARGEMLFFLDADDLITPDTVERLVEAVGGVPRGIACCECRGWRRGVDGRWGETERDVAVPKDGDDLVRGFLLHTAWPPTCSTLWRRDAYELAGAYDEEMVRDEDTDLLLRAWLRGARLVRAEGGVGFYRAFDGARASVSSGVSEARFRASVRVLDKLAAELERHGRLGEYAGLLSRSYHKAALHGFQQGFPDLARPCLEKGRALTGERMVISTNVAGRALERVLGLEGKERLARALAALGLGTPRRRQALALERAVRAAEP